MGFSITDFNINPNQDWYVKISQDGSDILVELYLSEADATGGVDMVASGSTNFGTDSEVTLVMEEGSSVQISFFNSDLEYHMKVAGSDSDTTKTFHISPFVDLEEISHNLYQSQDLLTRRAVKEINEHTHTSLFKDLTLATLVDGLEINDILEIDSDFRGKTTNNIVNTITIIGTHNSLTCSLSAVEFLDFIH